MGANEVFMKSKDPSARKLSDVIAEMQVRVEEEAYQGAWGQDGRGGLPAFVRLSSASSRHLPASLPLTQHYLSRHFETHTEILDTLPDDMFVIC